MKTGLDTAAQAFDYVHMAFSKYHNHQVNGYIELDGKVNIDVLEQAVNQTAIDLPQLRCRFQRGEYRSVDQHIKVERIMTTSSKKEVQKIMGESLDIAHGQQVRIVVVREQKNDIIVMVMSHLLCDGMAMKEYMYLVCSYYNRLLEGKEISHPFKGKERGIEWVREYNLPGKKGRQYKPKKERLMFSGGKIPMFAQCRITPSHYEKIRAYLMKNNATMNDLFMTVYYKAVWEVFQYPLDTLCCAVNLRRYMDKNKTIGLCNQTGNAFTSIKNSEILPFPTLLQEVHRQMDNEKEQGLCLKQIKHLEMAFDKLPHDISRKLIRLCISNPQIALTNLGTIEKRRITFHGMETKDCFLSPSLKQAPNFQMAVSTFENTILLQVNMMVSRKEREWIQEYLETYRKLLLGVVDNWKTAE